MPMALLRADAEVESSMPERPNCPWDLMLHLMVEGSLQLKFTATRLSVAFAFAAVV